MDESNEATIRNSIAKWENICEQLGGLLVKSGADGQLLIHTNIFVWQDGTIHNDPDPLFNIED